MAINIRKLFNEDLPAKLTRNPDVVRQIEAKYQINITGNDGGEWFIDASKTGPKLIPGNPGGADATLTIASEDFQKLYENPQTNGPALFLAGKMKLAGDQMLAMKLTKLFAI